MSGPKLLGQVALQMNYDFRLPLGGMCPAYMHLSRREAHVGIACTRFSDKPRKKPGRAPDNGEEDNSRQAVFWYVCIACVTTSLPVGLVSPPFAIE